MRYQPVSVDVVGSHMAASCHIHCYIFSKNSDNNVNSSRSDETWKTIFNMIVADVLAPIVVCQLATSTLIRLCLLTKCNDIAGDFFFGHFDNISWVVKLFEIIKGLIHLEVNVSNSVISTVSPDAMAPLITKFGCREYTERIFGSPTDPHILHLVKSSIKISLKLDPKGSLNNKPSLAQIMFYHYWSHDT